MSRTFSRGAGCQITGQGRLLDQVAPGPALVPRAVRRMSDDITVTRAVGVLGSAGALAGLGLTGAMPAMASPGAVHSAAVHRPAPFGRVWNSWAYDPAHHDVVLFGGSTDNAAGSPGRRAGHNLDVERALDRASSGPVAVGADRRGHGLDAATGQLLLFGGSTRPGTPGRLPRRYRTWSGRTWTRPHPAAAPSARQMRTWSTTPPPTR